MKKHVINDGKSNEGDSGSVSLLDKKLDHFIVHANGVYAGKHLIVDLYTTYKLDNKDFIEQVLRDAVDASNATLLHIHLHHFTPNYGVSGVAVLAESHISVHTWPEADYAAFDVFMCGDAKPHAAVEVFKQAFQPTKLKVSELIRGEVNAESSVV